jgi:hypothetical protein
VTGVPGNFIAGEKLGVVDVVPLGWDVGHNQLRIQDMFILDNVNIHYYFYNNFD